MTLLSIVMPSLLGRVEKSEMYRQMAEQTGDRNDVEFLCLMDNGPLSTGKKFFHLFDLCRGKYICAVGDDDKIEPDYVETLVKAIQEYDGVDCVTFDHTYNVNGEYLALTKQIVGCGERQYPREPDALHEVHHRLPGPLCPVRREIALAFDHPHISDREDTAYKDFLKKRLETFHAIDRVLYHHMWNSHNKRERQALKKAWHRE